MSNRTRNAPIYIYVSENERVLLEAKMKITGIKTISAYIRQLIRYGFVYEVDYAPIREMNAQLGKIGSSINQIARRINTTQHVYAEDMREVKEMMDKIWQLQKSILSQQPLIKR